MGHRGLIITYFALLDRGLNTAVQNEISRPGRDAEVRSTIVWTAVLFNAMVGLAAGIAVLIVGEIAFAWVVELPEELHQESIEALPLIAASVPFAMVSAIFQGALMARGRITTVERAGHASSVRASARAAGLRVLAGADLRWLALGMVVVFVLSCSCTRWHASSSRCLRSGSLDRPAPSQFAYSTLESG